MSFLIFLAHSATCALASYQTSLGGVSYWSPTLPVATFILPQIGETELYYEPITVLNVAANTTLTSSDYRSVIDTWTVQDDVFGQAFMSSVFINGGQITPSLQSNLTSSNVSSIFSTDSNSSFTTTLVSESDQINNGPYFATSNASHMMFYQVYRLYEDVTHSFMYGTVPAENGSAAYDVLPGAVAGDDTKTIAVPSRIYFTITAERPLAGFRVAVKDIYDLAGTRRGCGSRAYYSSYGPSTNNSLPVQRLVSAGAIIVGKTKTSQFANGENPTSDWVDYICPFNPRGDGYQSPSSSSSGSGAAMAAYPWLDFAIGSDTGGSIRDPASVQGLYGIRPSWGSMPLTGVMPLSSVMDTPGFFARDASSFQYFAKVWYEDAFSQNYTSFPSQILMDASFSTVPSKAMDLFNDFAVNLQKVMNISNSSISTLNISQAWTANNITSSSVSAYTNETYPLLITIDQYYNFSLPWIQTYRTNNNGQYPFIDPQPTTRWAYGIARRDQYGTAMTQKATFKNFWNNIIQTSNTTTCSNNIYLYPHSYGSTTYRNQYLSPPTVPSGFSSSRVSIYSSTPDIVVPIGQVAYNSTITRKIEYLPVTISLLAHPGCDYMLLDLINQMAQQNMLSSVKTGVTAF